MKTEYLVHPFAPLYDENSKVLILGSFPSVISREQNFYYANPQNRFWPLMQQLFDETIEDRRAFCLAHHIALWDVIASCRITGSSDAKIQEAKPNDIASLVNRTDIRAVFTTGSAASKLFQRHISLSIPHYPLPSTSSANARMRMNDLLMHYKIIREILNEEN